MKNPVGWLSRFLLRFTPSTVIVSNIVVLFLAGGALSADPLPADCEPRLCGGLNISYPFSIKGLQPPDCGYPGFEIDCKDDAPVVETDDHYYVVRNISYGNRSVVISSFEFLTRSACPYPRHNLSLARSDPFHLSPVNRDLFFYLNCTETLPGMTVLDCADDNEEGKVSLVAQRPAPANENVSPVCESVIVSHFLPAYGNTGDRNYTSLLKDGFLLEWTAPDCSRCETSGGTCGFNRTAQELMCFCSDRAHLVSCSGWPPPPQTNAGSSRTSRKIKIGVGAGVGGFLLASVVFFLLWYKQRRMKARTSSSTLLFRTTSSEPSSKKDPEMGGSTHYPANQYFRYDELHEATNGFSDSNELGDGGFGTVYKGELRDGRIVAVKRLYENNYKRVEQFQNEVAILNRLRHQNLVTLYGCTSRHSRELLLVYEYVPNGTVADHLHGPRAGEGGLTWPIRLNIAFETATALAYLHAVEPQIIHRDVKTNNILLDNSFHVKVADFGLSRLFPMDATHVSTAPQGTPGYVDPEYHQCYQLTDKSDVYSFGVVMVELISSKPAVDITRHRHEINLANMAINKIQSGALHELVDPALEFETCWGARRTITQVAELAFRCLQGEKDMRPCMGEVVGVLRGIQERQQERAEPAGEVENGAADDMSLLKSNPPVSPDSVMEKWTSRSTTPHTSA